MVYLRHCYTAEGPHTISLPVRKSEFKPVGIMRTSFHPYQKSDLAVLQPNYMQNNSLNKLPGAAWGMLCKSNITATPSACAASTMMREADSSSSLPFLPTSKEAFLKAQQTLVPSERGSAG